MLKHKNIILYIFNNCFPDNAGFGKRCLKEIEVLALKNQVIVICKNRGDEPSVDYINAKNERIKIIRFKGFFRNNEKIENYHNKHIIYEIIRTLDLFFGMIRELVKALWVNRKKKKKLYVIVSPLTVPLIAYLFGIFFSATPMLVEFHDLEPELAMHIKFLDNNNIVIKIEYFLEKLVCRVFKKVIVTTNTQLEIIVKRTGIKNDKIRVIPNSIQVENKLYKHVSKKEHAGFIIGYVSSFTNSYSTSTFLELIMHMTSLKSQLIHSKIIVVGTGDLLTEVKDTVNFFGLSDMFIFTGNVKDVSELLTNFDITIIPWPKDEMTETMLPTKLFEYMHAKKPIIAPNFGEFNKTLIDDSDALLYSTVEELLDNIIKLKNDKFLRERLGVNAFSKYKKYYKPEIYDMRLAEFIDL